LLNSLANKDKIYEFKAGGILPPNPLEPVEFRGKIYPGRKRVHSDLELAQYLKNSMGSTRCCYFEDLLHRREDRSAIKFKANTFYYHEEPYLFLNNNNFSVEEALRLIRHANAQWYYMNIISEEPEELDQEINIEKLEKIALGTICIVIGAYDMEGFVVWKKTKSLE